MSRFPVKVLGEMKNLHAFRDYLFQKSSNHQICMPHFWEISSKKIAITSIDNSPRVSVNDYKPGFLLFDYHRHVLSISLVKSD